MAEVVDALLLRIPPPLHDLVKVYAKRRSLSVNRAIRELMESHPELQRLYQEMCRNN